MFHPLPLLTWTLAVAGAASALGAALGRGRWSPAWVRRLNFLGYLFMGLSVALFVLRGFLQ
ncbi:MAG: hypothetical protein AB1814_03470 [Thermodesulfobacteriota bacterium]